VLSKHRLHLREIVLTESNISGRVFYQGQEFQCLNPEAEHVTVESYHTGQAIVRDDDPPRRHSYNNVDYHYVSTRYMDGTFYRYYVQIDTFTKLQRVDMSLTAMSGYGLTALCASSASSLQELRMHGCKDVDDRGMYAIAQLCRSLTYLDASACDKVTRHGFLYLAQMPVPQVQQLQYVNVTNECMYDHPGSALLHCLEDSGFCGNLVFQNKEHVGQPRQVSGLDQKYHQYPDRVIDMCYYDITANCVTDMAMMSLPSATDGKSVDDSEQEVEPTLIIDLSNQLVNDRVLAHVVARFGERIHTLFLNGTYITELGLRHLIRCPNLRALDVSKLWCIHDKQEANRNIIPAMNKMKHLGYLDISDTRLSGRMLSKNEDIRLETLNAGRCPITARAVRMLAELCYKSMHHLILCGCSFLNANAIHFFIRFVDMQTLDISHCTGLTSEDLKLFLHYPPEFLRSLKQIDISGIPGVTQEFAASLSKSLTDKNPAGTTIKVLWMSPSVENKIDDFRGGFPTDNCPYGIVDPAILSSLLASKATEQQLDKQAQIVGGNAKAFADNDVVNAHNPNAFLISDQTDAIKPRPEKSSPAASFDPYMPIAASDFKHADKPQQNSGAPIKSSTAAAIIAAGADVYGPMVGAASIANAPAADQPASSPASAADTDVLKPSPPQQSGQTQTQTQTQTQVQVQVQAQHPAQQQAANNYADWSRSQVQFQAAQAAALHQPSNASVDAALDALLNSRITGESGETGQNPFATEDDFDELPS
jgi:hypothetical protein